MSDFFKTINSYLSQCDLNITIKKKDGQLTVSVLPTNPQVDMDLKPLLFRGTPDELDAKFLNALKEPVLKTESAFSNVLDYEASLKAKTDAKTKKKATKGKESEEDDNEEGEEATTETKPKVDKKKKADDVLMGKGLKPEPSLFDAPVVAPKVEEKQEDPPIAGESPIETPVIETKQAGDERPPIKQPQPQVLPEEDKEKAVEGLLNSQKEVTKPALDLF